MNRIFGKSFNSAFENFDKFERIKLINHRYKYRKSSLAKYIGTFTILRIILIERDVMLSARQYRGIDADVSSQIGTHQ